MRRFFNHLIKIQHIIFYQNGPIAVLPAPASHNKKSTFIYSSKRKISKLQLQKLLNQKFSKSHGKIIFSDAISKFPINPHLTKNNDNFIYIGDSLKSIHPVAGQGWNLGVKDIQTLCKLLDQYSIENKNFNSFFYSRRVIESSIYLSFTSILNFLYESKNSYNLKFIKIGFMTQEKLNFLENYLSNKQWVELV